MLKRSLVGVSMFSSAGISECYLKDEAINIVAANELIPERANLYRSQFPEANMICGDIVDSKVFGSLVEASPRKIDFLIASPPCQGMSVAGKNRTLKQMLGDKRNFLFFRIVDFIKEKSPDYILIENVPNFLKLKLPYNGDECSIVEILHNEFGDSYNIVPNVYDAADYGVAQCRTRAIIKVFRKGRRWSEPEKCRRISVREAIGYLPSIEAGEHTEIKWHFARNHEKKQIECMRNTPTGQSAIDNQFFYPKKKNGERVRSYNTTYRRMKWDVPAPTITMRNDAISSQSNVHPGRKLSNGEYSDARVLTPLELMLLSSLPADWSIPDDTPELLIRKCIGECIPPMLIKKIVSEIDK